MPSLAGLVILIVIFGATTARFVTARLRIYEAVVSLQECGAIMSDERGPLEERIPPWGSVSDMLFSDVRYLAFRSETRRLRFSENFPTANPGLADPTSEEMIRLTDVDIANITRLTSLEFLDLQHTNVHDESLPCFGSLTRIRGIILGPNVTQEGVRRLQKQLPKCPIEY